MNHSCIYLILTACSDIFKQALRNTENKNFSFVKKLVFRIPTHLLKELVSFSLGIKTSDDSRFIFDSSQGSDYYKILRGKDINPYEINFNKKWIWYKPDLITQKAGGRPRIKANFFKEKILIKEIATNLQAAYDAESYLTLDTINIAFDARKEYSLKFLCALLNSKLLSYWFKNNYSTGLHIKLNQLEQIPIPQISLNTQIPIISLVNRILTAKAADPLADTSTSLIEAEIDRLVYVLYGLTDEEIAIVESDKGVSKLIK